MAEVINEMDPLAFTSIPPIKPSHFNISSPATSFCTIFWENCLVPQHYSMRIYYSLYYYYKTYIYLYKVLLGAFGAKLMDPVKEIGVSFPCIGV